MRIAIPSSVCLNLIALALAGNAWKKKCGHAPYQVSLMQVGRENMSTNLANLDMDSNDELLKEYLYIFKARAGCLLARIVALVGGPCTEGPGSIVSKVLSDPLRSHEDLGKDAVPYFRNAVQFYEELSKQMVSQGHVLDLFSSALDQV